MQPQPLYCSRCGHQNRDTDQYCAKCGAQLPRLEGPAAPEQGPPPPFPKVSRGDEKRALRYLALFVGLIIVGGILTHYVRTPTTRPPATPSYTLLQARRAALRSVQAQRPDGDFELVGPNETILEIRDPSHTDLSVAASRRLVCQDKMTYIQFERVGVRAVRFVNSRTGERWEYSVADLKESCRRGRRVEDARPCGLLYSLPPRARALFEDITRPT